MIEEVIHRRGFWTIQGPQSHVVLSSRLRLARNMKGLSFPHRMDQGEQDILRGAVERFAGEMTQCGANCIIDIHGIGNNEKRLLRERNIITSEMELNENSYVVVFPDEDYAILVNEEDHLRIQVIKPGLQFLEAYQSANRIDDELNRYIPFAFSDELGYLTASIRNAGTGLRASALVHLPVLTRNNSIAEVSESLKKRGTEIRSTIPNSTKTLGALYQISSGKSLGLSEVDILESIDGIVSEIVEMEDYARDSVHADSRNEIEDRIWRSYGTLQFSRRMTYIEALENLSNVRLGVILAVIKNYELPEINDIMVKIQWSHLQRAAGRVFVTTAECDEFRSEYLRSVIH